MFDALSRAFTGTPQDIVNVKGQQVKYLGYLVPDETDYGLAEVVAHERQRLGISGDYRVNKQRNEHNQAKYDLKGAAAEIVGIHGLFKVFSRLDVAELIAERPEKRPDVIAEEYGYRLDIKGASGVCKRIMSERCDKFVAINATAHKENKGIVDSYLCVYFETVEKAHIFIVGYDFVTFCEKKEAAHRGASPWYAVDVRTLIKASL